MRIKDYLFLMNSIDLGLMLEKDHLIYENGLWMLEKDQQSPLCNVLLTHGIGVICLNQVPIFMIDFGEIVLGIPLLILEFS